MSQLIQTSAPIIPVIDERLTCLASAPREHRLKVDEYNDLLEDIYLREVELGRIKSNLISMRSEIEDEARHLDGTSMLPRDAAAALDAAVRSDAESDENVLSDSGLSSGSGSSGKPGRVTFKNAVSVATIPVMKNGNVHVAANSSKKTKGRSGRLGSRHSKVPDAQLDAEWDYKLELGRGGKKGRRDSDESEDDDERV